MFALVLLTLDTRRSVGASVGSEQIKRDTEGVKSQKGLVLHVLEEQQIASVVL